MRSVISFKERWNKNCIQNSSTANELMSVPIHRSAVHKLSFYPLFMPYSFETPLEFDCPKPFHISR